MQRYQFSSPTDRPTCVAYAPKPPPPLPEGCGGGGGGVPEEEGGVEQAAAAGAGAGGEERWHLVAGYASGAVRVFDVPSTSTLLELEQHRSAVQQVGIMAGNRSFACCNGGCRDWLWRREGLFWGPRSIRSQCLWMCVCAFGPCFPLAVWCPCVLFGLLSHGDGFLIPPPSVAVPCTT